MRRTRPAARIARTVPVAKKLPDPRRNANHLKFIRSLPCCCCGAAAPSEAAHIRLGTDGGVGLKPHDKWTIPLCHQDHTRQHAVGEVQYWGSLGVDPYGLAEHLWKVSGDVSAGTRAALRRAMEITTKRMSA